MVDTNTTVTVSSCPTEPCPAVPVLPGPGSHCHVPTQQQQSVPRIQQEPSAGVPQEGTDGLPVHRRPHAVPLHQGARLLPFPHVQTANILPLFPFIYHAFAFVLFPASIGAPDGGVCHCSPGVQAQHL